MTKSDKDEGIIKPQDRESPEAARHRSKPKDKRWCRGKVGREHVWDVAKYGWIIGPCQQRWTWQGSCGHYRACTVCGKYGGSLTLEECPDQVDH